MYALNYARDVARNPINSLINFIIIIAQILAVCWLSSMILSVDMLMKIPGMDSVDKMVPLKKVQKSIKYFLLMVVTWYNSPV